MCLHVPLRRACGSPCSLFSSIIAYQFFTFETRIVNLLSKIFEEIQITEVM